jgi:hypothetical protein
LLAMAIPHAVLGRIQVGFQPGEDWKRTSLRCRSLVYQSQG